MINVGFYIVFTTKGIIQSEIVALRLGAISMTVRPKALNVANPIVNQGRFIMNVIFIRQEKLMLVNVFKMTKQNNICIGINSSEHSNYQQVRPDPSKRKLII